MSKKIVILLSIILFLGALVLLLDNPFEDRFSTEEELFYPDLKKEEIAAIEIEHFIQGVRFEKKEKAEWLVKEFETPLAKQVGSKPEANQAPADPQKIDQIITVLTELKKETPISANPEKQGLLQISKAGLNVTFLDGKGKKIARLFIGKQGPDLFSSFVRDEKSDDVYLVEGNLQGLLNRRFEDWQRTDQPTDLK
ncbi:MAG: DUF4340 domain-containing protein [Deltaproteobacteria bacterium]|nr:DUF4340 domain-containing protein [Deltaproteobacteria bacterium]